MGKGVYDQYLRVLHEELIAALGCTEPIAIAYASAVARKELGILPEEISAVCSGNIIKNVKGVTVPNSGGQKGIKAAAILGAIGGDPDKKLEVLNSVTPEDIAKSKELEKTDYCKMGLAEGVSNLYIEIVAGAGDDRVRVEILDSHINIINIEKNGVQVFAKERTKGNDLDTDKFAFMTVDGILDFADSFDPGDLAELLEMQIDYNSRIAQEGIENPYGTNVGKRLLDLYGDNVAVVAKAMAVAGADARMSGSDLAVVINSGSGNQGITVSLPVIVYAHHLEVGKEKLYRALALSNLMSLYVKSGIGSLSAFCGAVSAGSASSAGITYLLGGTRQEIKDAVSNSLAIGSGMVCDGAKPSCAGKVALSVEGAMVGSQMALKGENFSPGKV